MDNTLIFKPVAPVLMVVVLKLVKTLLLLDILSENAKYSV